MVDLESLLIENHDMICHLVASKVPGSDADDVVQDICLQLTKTIHLFNGDSSFDTWMGRIIRNGIATYYRKKNRVMDSHTDLTADGNIPRGAYSPVIYLDLEDSLAFIPEQYRKVLAMRYWDGLSDREISARLGLRREAVRSRRRRGLAYCRRNINVAIQELGNDRDIEIEWAR